VAVAVAKGIRHIGDLLDVSDQTSSSRMQSRIARLEDLVAGMDENAEAQAQFVAEIDQRNKPLNSPSKTNTEASDFDVEGYSLDLDEIPSRVVEVDLDRADDTDLGDKSRSRAHPTGSSRETGKPLTSSISLAANALSATPDESTLGNTETGTQLRADARELARKLKVQSTRHSPRRVTSHPGAGKANSRSVGRGSPTPSTIPDARAPREAKAVLTPSRRKESTLMARVKKPQRNTVVRVVGIDALHRDVVVSPRDSMDPMDVKEPDVVKSVANATEEPGDA